MAFLNQISSKFQEIKNNQIPQIMEQANKARQNVMPVINKCTQQLSSVGHQLDAIGKILQVNVNPKQSPIDLLPSITAFDPSLENAAFKLTYKDTGQLAIQNTGACVSVKFPDDSTENFTASFIPDEQFHLEKVNFHWGTEPMNGSEHTVGGVGYAGEIHLIHRNVKHPNIDLALKQPNGVLGISIFLNETRDDNVNLSILTNALSNILYRDSECTINSFNVGQFFGSLEKNKEFWVYDGSETIEPFRESVKWIVCRSAVAISSAQLEKFRQLRKSRAEDEVEETLTSIRQLQPPNSRLIRSSFKSVAQAELPQ